MSSDAWIYQRIEQVQKIGAEAASWYEPDGKRQKKSCGPGFKGKQNAEKLKRKIEAELMTGTYETHTRKLWPDFRQEYEHRVLAGLAIRSRTEAAVALDHFERLMKPVRVFAINTGHVDDFIAKRRTEKGKKKGCILSPASVNKDLRHLKAALRVAVDWGYLTKVPRFRMERVPKKLATYITGDHFAAIYHACAKARLPLDLPYPAVDWWQALLTFAYMTGWRISDMLGFRREDLDLDAATAITRSEDNKGKRDDKIKLHPIVVEHLRKIVCFDPCVFPWHHNRRTLQSEFAKIQETAGIHLPCKVRQQHEHTRFCHVYGFHDLRRAFATMNADKLTADALQALMRHQSYQTTQVYINMARQMDAAVASLHVPDVFQAKAAN
jgi:integrase